MNLQEIIQAINNGQTVYWSSGLYTVVTDGLNGYHIKCSANGHRTPLTKADGKTLNGNEKDFFI